MYLEWRTRSVDDIAYLWTLHWFLCLLLTQTNNNNVTGLYFIGVKWSISLFECNNLFLVFLETSVLFFVLANSWIIYFFYFLKYVHFFIKLSLFLIFPSLATSWIFSDIIQRHYLFVSGTRRIHCWRQSFLAIIVLVQIDLIV